MTRLPGCSIAFWMHLLISVRHTGHEYLVPTPGVHLVVGSRCYGGSGHRYFGLCTWIKKEKRILAEESVQQLANNKEAARQKHILDAVVSNMPYEFVIKDPDGKYLAVNNAYLELARFSREDVLGKSAHDLFPKEIADGFLAWDKKVIESRKAHINETFLNFHGEDTTHITKRFPIIDEDDQPIGAAMVSTNITDLKRTEALLRQAKVDAENANRAKSEFLANMSHELRTPLNAILGFSQMLSVEPYGALGDPKYVEMTNYIHDGGSHLLEIINEILDLARVESRKVTLKEENLDLEETVSRVAVMMSSRADGEGVDLKNTVPADLPLLRGDDRILRQVLLNLMSGPAESDVEFREVHARGWCNNH